MDHVRVKYAVLAVLALHQGLSVVFESVRWRLFALVAYGQCKAVFYKYKIRIGSTCMDRSGLHVPGDSKMLFVSIISHGT